MPKVTPVAIEGHKPKIYFAVTWRKAWPRYAKMETIPRPGHRRAPQNAFIHTVWEKHPDLGIGRASRALRNSYHIVPPLRTDNKTTSAEETAHDKYTPGTRCGWFLTVPQDRWKVTQEGKNDRKTRSDYGEPPPDSLGRVKWPIHAATQLGQHTKLGKCCTYHPKEKLECNNCKRHVQDARASGDSRRRLTQRK